MSIAELITAALKAAIIVTVFGLGLRTDRRDVLSLLRQPSLLFRSLLAMNIIMPLFAVGAVLVMTPARPIAIALIALSLAPIPPLLPKKQVKAGGDAAYIVGLLAAVSLVSIVWIPLAIELVQRVAGVPLSVAPMDVVGVVGITVLAPLLAGVAVHWLAKPFAEMIEPILSRAALLVLLIGVVLILAVTWRGVLEQIGDGTILLFAAFIVVGLAVGHLLGGPVPADRTVLAIATSSRHPGMALAIAQLNFPNEKTVVAAILLYLLLNAVISLPYVAWRKRLNGAPAAPTLAD